MSGNVSYAPAKLLMAAASVLYRVEYEPHRDHGTPANSEQNQRHAVTVHSGRCSTLLVYARPRKSTQCVPGRYHSVWTTAVRTYCSFPSSSPNQESKNAESAPHARGTRRQVALILLFGTVLVGFLIYTLVLSEVVSRLFFVCAVGGAILAPRLYPIRSSRASMALVFASGIVAVLSHSWKRCCHIGVCPVLDGASSIAAARDDEIRYGNQPEKSRHQNSSEETPLQNRNRTEHAVRENQQAASLRNYALCVYAPSSSTVTLHAHVEVSLERIDKNSADTPHGDQDAASVESVGSFQLSRTWDLATHAPSHLYHPLQIILWDELTSGINQTNPQSVVTYSKGLLPFRALDASDLLMGISAIAERAEAQQLNTRSTTGALSDIKKYLSQRCDQDRDNLHSNLRIRLRNVQWECCPKAEGYGNTLFELLWWVFQIPSAYVQGHIEEAEWTYPVSGNDALWGQTRRD